MKRLLSDNETLTWGAYHAGARGATAAAARLGNARALSILMLGCLSRFAPFEVALWKECIPQRLPSRLLGLNLRAFDLGREEIGDGHL